MWRQSRFITLPKRLAAAFDAYRHGIAIGLGVTLIQARSRRANHSQGLLVAIIPISMVISYLSGTRLKRPTPGT
jgi:hypothetical protein